MNRGAELVIMGAGGHGRVCADVAAAAGFTVAAFCDVKAMAGEAVNGIRLLKAAAPGELVASFDPAQTSIFVAIGDNATRTSLIAQAEAAGFGTPSLIHPSAVVSPTADIGPATVLAPGSIVNANARVGRGCILNTACSLDHDNLLEDGVQICPGVRAAGNVTFGARAFVGTGAVIIPGIRIGRDAHIGAGALITADVGDGERVRQFPARPVRR